MTQACKRYYVVLILICSIVLSEKYALATDGIVSSPSPVFQSDIEHDAKFRALLEQTQLLEKDLRVEINRVERLQPEWDSGPLKAQLDKSMTSMVSLHECDYWACSSLFVLSCQTPLVYWKLVRLANSLFWAPHAWCQAHNMFWVRSGNDLSGLLPDMPGRSRSLATRLAEEWKLHHSHAVTEMRVALNRCIHELDRGDTDSAIDCGWQLLKLSEDSGNYEIASDVIGWYHLLLDTMSHRPSWNAYTSKRNYVSRESQCVTTDRDFVASLNRSQFQSDPQVVKRLLELHTALVRRRRNGDEATTKELYATLVDLAEKSGDPTCAIQYFALSAYYAFLSTQGGDINYEEWRERLKSAWSAEELGKQKFLAESNSQLGGDWKRLEAALDSLREHSILVCRDLQLCQGEKNTASLLELADRSAPIIGMTYYQKPAVGQDLFLVCRGQLKKGPCEPHGDPKRNTSRQPQCFVGPLSVSIRSKPGSRSDCDL